MCSIVLLDISDIYTQIYYLLKNMNFHVEGFLMSGSKFLKQSLDIFNMKSRRMIIKNCNNIILKTVHESRFLFMGDPGIKNLLFYCVTISQSSHIVNIYVFYLASNIFFYI